MICNYIYYTDIGDTNSDTYGIIMPILAALLSLSTYIQ